jgi:molybdopterin-containing oxidoreductase family iron-sulfur binding subunit
MERREFLRTAGGSILLATSGSYAFQLLTAPSSDWSAAGKPLAARKWGMVVDLTRCRSDCGACLEACRTENNVAFHGDQRYDIHWIRKARLKSEGIERAAAKSVLLLCNHCDRPPCAQVCPVQATYKRHDGIVIVDHHRCIGCRYCMIACPYNARFFNFIDNEDWPNKERPRRSHGVAEACHLCAHRLDQGRLPACVEACNRIGASALMVGDLNDPQSGISSLVAGTPVKRIRPDLGTDPKVYYVGL